MGYQGYFISALDMTAFVDLVFLFRGGGDGPPFMNARNLEVTVFILTSVLEVPKMKLESQSSW